MPRGNSERTAPPDAIILDESVDSFETAVKNGTINITVWTVGENDTDAFYIQLQGGTLVDMKAYDNSVLGYDSKKNIPSIIKNTITDLIDDFAMFFFRNRDEL